MTKKFRSFASLLKDLNVLQLDSALAADIKRSLPLDIIPSAGFSPDERLATAAETLDHWVASVLEEKGLEAEISDELNLLQSVCYAFA